MSEFNNINVSRLSNRDEDKIYAFLDLIFNREQNIPIDLIRIKSEKIFWWGIKNDEEIIGVAATWIESGEWHWGRFSIHPELRGQGYGEKLASFSIKESFNYNIDHLVIEARDAVVPLIQKMGGTIIGETQPFYSENITLMKLEKRNFNTLKS
ncbi:GNAT family N-acetyltransferase [Marivirga arenosa]|uniref:GNAT family N-acetyltransferase n=1 Tax=Marivirga arenosa TaxID=3059076 RepID=A0AA49GFC3_9BACT|nr:GNAT family N-acetyltransferase [Marivirga sp. BKB1-2]WKK82275.2 GNAT family N-acetyltransferase [Marivirga sp. BKB1-2]